MSAVFGVKTVMVIHDHLFTNGVHRSFAWNTVPESTHNKTFFAEYADTTSQQGIIARAVSIVGNEEYNEEVENKRSPSDPVNIVTISDSGIVNIRKFENSAITNFVQEKDKLIVACVLKSGGVYDTEYPRILESMVKRNLTVPHQFIVLSDVECGGQNTLPLEGDLPGWWSKLELFNLTGRVLYLDLDTVIMSSIDRLAKNVMQMDQNEFRMLIPFSPGRREKGLWASGVMAWNGDFRYLMKLQKGWHKRQWDQDHISIVLKSKGVDVKPINQFSEIYSVKRHCTNKTPSDAEIICFHGNEKPHTAKQPWAIENWR